LEVAVPVRIIEEALPRKEPFEVWWRGQQRELLKFELMAG
jgi:hypothetical protein